MTLHSAAAASDLAQFEALLNDGVDVNMRDNEDTTAVQCAARHNYAMAIKLLHKRGADLNAMSTPDNSTAMHVVACYDC